MKKCDELTNDEWALIQPFLDAPASNARRGRPPVNTRIVVNAVLWVLASNGNWAGLPGRYPSQTTCRRRFEKWQVDGTLTKIVSLLETGGRKISLPNRNALTTVKSTTPARALAPDRLRGAFWTNPASWRVDPIGHYRQSDLVS